MQSLNGQRYETLSQFNVLLILMEKSQNGVHKPYLFKRKDSQSGELNGAGLPA